MYSDMVEWRGHNPPPATMMIISNQVEDVFTWDLVRLQQRTRYNLFLAYSIRHVASLVLLTSAQWLWEKLLGSADNNKIETRSAPLVQAMFYCKSCNFDGQSLEKFRKHLSSYNHAREEAVNPTSTVIDCVTDTWGRNYPATPEYATAKILVWWCMFSCPIPEGYDARCVRPSFEAAFKSLGYSGPVSITAYGILNDTPDHIIQGLSSTGVDFAHTRIEDTRMYSDVMDWSDSNPPPATIMVISDDLYPIFSSCLAHILQRQKHNLFLAYPYRPNHNLSVLLTSAEWLWESLLAVSETTRHVLQKCSTVSETRIQKCSGSETDRGESTGVFYCKLCFCDLEGPDYKSLDDFRTHLSSEEHARKENGLAAYLKFHRQEQKLSRLAQYDREHREQWRREASFSDSGCC